MISRPIRVSREFADHWTLWIGRPVGNVRWYTVSWMVAIFVLPGERMGLILQQGEEPLMQLGYTVRASMVMVRHPAQGIERIRGRLDRHGDKRALAALSMSASEYYGAAPDWMQRLHCALSLPWPCPDAASFGEVWDRVLADLTRAGVRVGDPGRPAPGEPGQLPVRL